MKLEGNTILITGGASGIGLALVKKFTQLNNTVLVVGRDRNKLEMLRQELPAVEVFPCDISMEEERLALKNRLCQLNRSINVIINNAGVQFHSSFVESQPSAEEVLSEIETNLIAPIRLISLFMEDLQHQPYGAIINISSGLALTPKASAPIYCATKAALSSFTRSLRYQLEHSSIAVYDVKAPLVETDMTRGRGRGKISPEAFAEEVVKGLKQGKEDMPIGKVKHLSLVHRLIPSLAYRIMKNG